MYVSCSDGQQEALERALKEAGISYQQVIEPTRANVKKLPRLADGSICPIFEANGTRYTITDMESGVAILRYQAFAKLYAPFQWGQRDFDAMVKFIEASLYEIIKENDINKLKIDAVNRLQSFRDGVVDIGSERLEKAMAICTIFVLREGEDALGWSVEEAQQKVEDWRKEGYDYFDFFTLSVGIFSDFLAAYNKIVVDIQKQKDTLSGLMDAIATNPAPTDGNE